MTPAGAKSYHEIQLMENSEEIDGIIKILADAQVNPTDKHVYGLYNKHR
jgi:hypothetical protein